jgi:hypothetical protein
MPRELTLFGIFFPSLLVAFLIVIPLYWLLDGMLARTGFYTQVWHIGLFRLALFVIMFGALGLYFYR